MHYVYIVRCADSTLYPLVYWESFDSKSDALKREHASAAANVQAQAA